MLIFFCLTVVSVQLILWLRRRCCVLIWRKKPLFFIHIWIMNDVIVITTFKTHMNSVKSSTWTSLHSLINSLFLKSSDQIVLLSYAWDPHPKTGVDKTINLEQHSLPITLKSHNNYWIYEWDIWFMHPPLRMKATLNAPAADCGSRWMWQQCVAFSRITIGFCWCRLFTKTRGEKWKLSWSGAGSPHRINLHSDLYRNIYHFHLSHFGATGSQINWSRINKISWLNTSFLFHITGPWCSVWSDCVCLS